MWSLYDIGCQDKTFTRTTNWNATVKQISSIATESYEIILWSFVRQAQINFSHLSDAWILYAMDWLCIHVRMNAQISTNVHFAIADFTIPLSTLFFRHSLLCFVFWTIIHCLLFSLSKCLFHILSISIYIVETKTIFHNLFRKLVMLNISFFN